MSTCSIDYHLLPIKAHYFCFMAAAGAILPFLPVLARALGVSAAVLGFITALLPVAVFLAKPTFGALSDRFPKYRHSIFLFVVVGQALSLSALGLIPPTSDDISIYTSTSFWIFVALMCMGNVCFNVANSLSDAICFEVLGPGQELQYGKQRVWGCFGWGGAALVSGALMSWWGEGIYQGLAPACIITLVFGIFDTILCIWLKLPKREASGSMVQDLIKLMRHRSASVFLIFAAFIGILDGFIIYYLLWYLEDLAGATTQLKLLEGLVVASQTLGGEVLFFPLSGWILRRLGHSHCMTLVFSTYALRLGLLSIVPGPWWMIPIELCLQGPTYALGYATIVAYANAVAPVGTAATVQGIAAGVDDSLGYSIGSLLGGQLFRTLGGRGAFQSMSLLALACCASHLTIVETLKCSKRNKTLHIEASPSEMSALNQSD